MESKKSDITQELEKRFLPILREMADEISCEFPQVKTNIWSWSIGASTVYQGHDVGIECLLSRMDPDQPDIVMLTIETMHLITLPKITAVDVCWNDGSLEKELLSEPLAITEEAFKAIEIGLPRMFNSLKEAIRRGHPLNP